MIKKIKLFDQLDDLYVEQEVLMKQSSAYKQKNNIKWVDLVKKRGKVWKKIDKLERFTWSKEARDSFKKFEIEGIEESGGSRGFTFKNKQIKLKFHKKPNCSLIKIFYNRIKIPNTNPLNYKHQIP